MMKITKEQREKIDTLTCERLSYQDLSLISKLDESYFYNEKNDGIAQTLRNEACEEDEANKKAYYIIKDSDNDVLFFFSLKCGLLYDHYIDGRFFEYLKDMSTYIESILQDEEISEEELKIVEEIKEKIRTTKGLTKTDIQRIPKKGDTVFDDLEKEFNESITHVGETYSGIELVHFCTNDSMSEKITGMNLGNRLGVIVFWEFVVKIVIETMKLVGCEYLFLFAADKSEDEDLISYYRSQLGFEDASERSTAKPVYDFTCKFMYQSIKDIKQRQELFFNNYNITEEI